MLSNRLSGSKCRVSDYRILSFRDTAMVVDWVTSFLLRRLSLLT